MPLTIQFNSILRLICDINCEWLRVNALYKVHVQGAEREEYKPDLKMNGGKGETDTLLWLFEVMYIRT